MIRLVDEIEALFPSILDNLHLLQAKIDAFTELNDEMAASGASGEKVAEIMGPDLIRYVLESKMFFISAKMLHLYYFLTGVLLIS